MGQRGTDERRVHSCHHPARSMPLCLASKARIPTGGGPSQAATKKVGVTAGRRSLAQAETALFGLSQSRDQQAADPGLRDRGGGFYRNLSWHERSPAAQAHISRATCAEAVPTKPRRSGLTSKCLTEKGCHRVPSCGMHSRMASSCTAICSACGQVLPP